MPMLDIASSELLDDRDVATTTESFHAPKSSGLRHESVVGCYRRFQRSLKVWWRVKPSVAIEKSMTKA